VGANFANGLRIEQKLDAKCALGIKVRVAGLEPTSKPAMPLHTKEMTSGDIERAKIWVHEVT
jgi:hypothetical protein